LDFLHETLEESPDLDKQENTPGDQDQEYDPPGVRVQKVPHRLRHKVQ
jgi:hypothetical protein